MSTQSTVTINGVKYDRHTGMPLDEKNTTSTAHQSASHAKSVHAHTQRSHTLNRTFIEKPKVKAHAKQSSPVKAHIERSPQISRFAKDPAPVANKKRTVMDVAPTTHPIVAKTQQQPSKPAVHKSASDIKKHAISEAMAKAAPTKREKSKKQRSRILNIASASLAIVLLAGYFTYLNMPSLSVRVAAAQAGINATYPDYRPTGYRLDGPVAYSNGQVSMKFAANASSQSFALNQAKSGWDSSALLTNYVDPRSNGNYATYNDGGLTVYTYDTNAAWVNGGILYTIEGDASLSNEQVLHIATSM